MALKNKKGTNKHGISNIYLLIKLQLTVQITCIYNVQPKNSYFLS